MAEQFYTIPTAIGKAKIANSIALGAKVNLKTMKIGDSNGIYYNPSESQTDLVHTVYSCEINSIEIDESNSNWINVVCAIPADVGDFFIREVGIFDDNNDLIAIGKYPETYKPLASNGSTKELYIKMIFEVTNVSSVTLKIDPTVILATKNDINILTNSIAKLTTQMSDIIIKNNNKSLSFGINAGNTGVTEINQFGISNLKTYGITTYRIGIWWEGVESSKGVFDFSYIDSTIKEFVQNGIKPLIVLCDALNPIYVSENPTDTGHSIVTEGGRKAFANFAKACAIQYKDYDIDWELWNEPNLESFWNGQATAPYNYYLLLKEVYNAIKSVKSSFKVYGCSLSNPYRPEEGYQYRVPQFFIDFCMLGGLNYMDALSIHPYSIQEPEMLGIVYNTYKGLIGTFNNKDMEIVITEFGYTIPPNWNNEGMTPLPSLSDTQRGQYYLRSFMINLIHGISVQVIHGLYSLQDDDGDPEKWFSLFNKDKSPTEAMSMIKSFLSDLGTDSVLLFHEQPRSADYLVYFKKLDNSIACVYWTRNDEHTINHKGIDFDLTQTPQVMAIDSSLIDLDSEIEEYNRKTKNDNGDVLYSYGNALTKTPDEGAMFGDSYKCYAGVNSISLGIMSVAYPSNVYIINSYTENILKLNSVSGLTIGNSVIIKSSWDGVVYAKITNIDTTTLTVTLNKTVYTGAKYLLYKPEDLNTNASFSEGANTLSTGYGSHAEGTSTISLAEGSHAEGHETIASDYVSHAEGNNTLAGSISHVEGTNNCSFPGTAYKITSIDTTNNTITLDSTNGLTINKQVAIKIDWGKPILANILSINGLVVTLDVNPTSKWVYLINKKSDDNLYTNHVEGVNNLGTGRGSHVSGTSNVSTKSESFTTGNYNNNLADYASIFGVGNIANENISLVTGHYNLKASSNSVNSNNQLGNAFVIGNGTSDTTRGNAFRVTYAGGVYGLSAYNASGADYAEYFEWGDENENNEDRCGYFVTLDGTKIKIATAGDYILGVISANPCVIGNGDEDWLGKYEHDEFGRFIYEDVEEEIEQVNSETGEISLVKTGNIIKNGRMKLNPDYDNAKEYISRADRSEWDLVGMLGVLAVRDDGTCQVNGYCSVDSSGIATNSANVTNTYRVIARVNDNIIKIIFR